MKIIIVGGVAGGATAAARLRRLNENAQIIMLEKGKYISYANCGLPYYIGNVITSESALQVQTPAEMAQRFNIDIRTQHEAITIDSQTNTLTIHNHIDNITYTEQFDALVLSCGAKPIMPNITGIKQASNVFTLRDIPDTYAIKQFVSNAGIAKATVIGGGFIGVEMAENLSNLGLEVALVEKLPQVLKPLDFEMAQLVHAELGAHGVNAVLGDGIKSFKNNGKTIELESGKTIQTDIAILAIGVSPENALAKQANFLLGTAGHLKTDANFNVINQYNEPIKNIFAIGDMIEVTDFLTETPTAIPLAWGANRQGRLVADIIMGKQIKPSKIMGSSVLKVFDLTVATTGANEATLKQKGISYQAIHTHRANHASYYPNATNIALKLLFDPVSGKIFGAQAVGGEGTEKRIDVLATAIKLGGTVFDLSGLELCYAPPFSSAKDPVNILGYMAENYFDGMFKVLHANELEQFVQTGGKLLDVRTPFEFEHASIKNSVNYEVDALRNHLAKFPFEKTEPIAVICEVGTRAHLAIQTLRAHGYTNLHLLSGGFRTYKQLTYQFNKTSVNNAMKGDDMQSGNNPNQTVQTIDVCGLQCPGPLLSTYKALESIAVGEVITVVASDTGFKADVQAWCLSNGHNLLSLETQNGKIVATISKGAPKTPQNAVNAQTNATIVVFSGELDKVLASMIIAQGAAAQGKDVTVFFTFWGLNALRRHNRVKTKKTLIERMFGFMMPRGANRLPLSSMNMGGMGSRMIKGIMRKKNVDSLPQMLLKAQQLGVKLIACTMSMDLMGIKPEELIEGVDFAGVATYISKNENVGTTLFI